MSEQIILGIPGVWKNQREALQAISAHSSDFLYAGFTLMDTKTEDVSFVEFHDHDPRLVDVFEMLGEPWIDEQTLRQIAAHRSTLWVLSSDVSIDHARRMVNVGRALLAAGGLGVKVETAGVVHSAARWNQFAAALAPTSPPKTRDAADLDELYCAYVNLLEAEDHFYSCGMHNFGLPDAAAPLSLGEPQATQLLNAFHAYHLMELPQFEDGDQFTPQEGGAIYQLRFQTCHPYTEHQPLYNPYGRWEILPG